MDEETVARYEAKTRVAWNASLRASRGPEFLRLYDEYLAAVRMLAMAKQAYKASREAGESNG